MDLNIRILCFGTFLLLLFVALTNCMIHECIPGKYQNPIIWVRPGEPIVLKSPDNFRVKQAEILNCAWEVRPLWGTKLAMQVNEKNIDYNCNGNKLKVYSMTNSFDYETACGKGNFPSELTTTVDEGPIMVSFESNSNDGSVKFSLTFLSVDPPKVDPDWVKKGNCSSGPCCQGDDCCVYHIVVPVGTDDDGLPKQLLKPLNFPGDQIWGGLLKAPGSKPDLDCVFKLKAQPGFQVSINFKEMDMLQGADGACNEDYVRIYEDVKKRTFGLLGKKGLTFCGQHLPNSPAPSVFASSSNEVYIRYRTDIKNKKRGTGFKLVATAINPLVTMTQFSHKYGDNTCKDKCEPTIPPTPPPVTTTIKPPDECLKRENLIFISNATTPHEYVSNAKVKFTLTDALKTEEFTKTTNNKGLIDFSTDLPEEPRIESSKSYTVTIVTDDFVEKTVNVHLHCEKQTAEKLCPSCYFTERVTPPPRTTPSVVTGKPGETTPKKPVGTTARKPTRTTPSVVTGKPVGTTPKKPVGTTARKPTETTTKKTVVTTPRKPGQTTPSKKPGTPPTGKTTVSAKPASTTPVQSTVYKATTPAVGTTAPPNQKRYPQCGSKDFVSPTNQLICDCTVTKCKQEIKQKTGECEPCIDIPVREIPPTTPSPPCDGGNCTTILTTPTQKPCTQIDDRKIKITVTDKSSTGKIDKANVTLNHVDVGFIGTQFTNEQGHATIPVNVDGKFIVNVTKRGYENSQETTTVKCTMAEDCSCHVEVDAKITRIERCKEGSSIEIGVEHQTGDEKKDLYLVVKHFFLTKHGKIGHNTQIDVNAKRHKNLKGIYNHQKEKVVYNVTGMVPDSFTFKIWNVAGSTDYETKQETIEFKMCPEDSTWTEDCCKKQHTFKVKKYHPVTEITEAATGPTSTMAPCTYDRKDSLHISVCGDESYKAYGNPKITLYSVDDNIIKDVPLDTLDNGEIVADDKLKCTGIYADKTLIKEFDPELQDGDMSNARMIVTVNGTNFKETRNETIMDCDIDRCQNCTKRLQVLITPIICNQEFFTIIVKECTTNKKIRGAKVTAIKSDGTVYAEKPTDEEGIAKIQIDRSIQNLQFKVSKTGYDTKDEDKDISCSLKECGKCAPKLTTTICPPKRCSLPMYINVSAKDMNGNPIKNADVTLILQKSIAQASSRILENEVTNDEGKVRLNVPDSGTYQVQIKSTDYIDADDETVIKDCETKNVTFTLELNPSTTPQPVCKGAACTSPKPPCKDTQITFNVHDISLSIIPGKPLDLKDAKITVDFIKKDGQTVVPVDVSVALKTDTKGVLRIPASTNGNYSYSLSKKGYLKDPTTGFIIVDCDADNCDACKPTVNITVEKPHCNRTIYPKNFFVSVTDAKDHSPLPGAEVILTLKKYGENVVTDEIGKRRTLDDGIVSFLNPVNGEYSLEITQTNYVKNTTKEDFYCDPEQCQTCNKSIVIPMVKEFCQDAKLKVEIKDSKNNKPVVGAYITVTMDGMANGVKRHIEKQAVNDSGIIYIPLDMNGKYKFIVEADGYLTYSDTHEVDVLLKDCEAYLPIKTVPLSPNDICKNGVRLSLTWGKNPMDLDLYSFRMLYEDSKDYCQTYYCDRKEQCGCTTFDTDNLYDSERGSETITICCRDLYSYMLYVDDRSGLGKFLSESDARITLTSNDRDQKINLARPATGAPAYKRYWIAGCLTTGGEGNFKYIPVNQFTEIQPSTSEPLLCHNLVNTDREEQKRANFPENIDLPVSAIDIATHKNVDGVLIKLAAIGNDNILQQEKITASSTARANAKLLFQIGENAKYSVTAEKEGYTSTPVIITINCNKTSCNVRPITIFLLKNLPTGDIRISLTYQEQTKYYLNLFEVNKQNSEDSCDALESYDYENKKLSCKVINLEWTSSPRVDTTRDGNGDSFLLKNASSNTKYTYLVYVADIQYPDEYTYLTLSDSKRDVGIKVTQPNQPLIEGFWIAGCLEIVGTSFNFVPKNMWTVKNPKVDGRFMCHELFTDPKRPATWKELPTFCETATLEVVVKNTEGNSIGDSVTTSTTVMLEDGTNSKLKNNELIGNGVYTTKVQADGYITDNVERTVKCDVEDCDNCKPSTEIILHTKKVVTVGGTILSVTSQTGAELKFVIYEGESETNGLSELGDDVILIPPFLKKNTTITFAVAQNSSERRKLNDTDAVFTLRYGESLVKLKVPSDPYNNEKYWLIGSLKVKQCDEMEFFSDNFYANDLEVFRSIQRSIGLTLPEYIPPADGNVSCGDHRAATCCRCGSDASLCSGDCKWSNDRGSCVPSYL